MAWALVLLDCSPCLHPLPLVLQRDRLEAHPMFERVSDEELEGDAAAQLLLEGTEEGQKVARNSGKTWRHVYRRILGPSEQAAAATQQQQAGGS